MIGKYVYIVGEKGFAGKLSTSYRRREEISDALFRYNKVRAIGAWKVKSIKHKNTV